MGGVNGMHNFSLTPTGLVNAAWIGSQFPSQKRNEAGAHLH
jgi:hypothetical protein